MRNPSSREALKSQCRKELRTKLELLNSEKKRRKSARITARLLRLRCFLRAENILTYAALADEVQTQMFIKKSLRCGKHVFIPRVSQKKKVIEIFQVFDFDRDLRRGAFGILEPRRRVKRKARAAQMDLMIIPGVGFSRQGARLGRGGGYFDRFLSRANKAVKIGVAFKEQICAKIPAGTRDIRMDRVITD